MFTFTFTFTEKLLARLPAELSAAHLSALAEVMAEERLSAATPLYAPSNSAPAAPAPAAPAPAAPAPAPAQPADAQAWAGPLNIRIAKSLNALPAGEEKLALKNAILAKIQALAGSTKLLDMPIEQRQAFEEFLQSQEAV